MISRNSKLVFICMHRQPARQRTAVLEPLDTLLHQFESEYHYLFKRVYEEAHRATVNGSMEQNYGCRISLDEVRVVFLAYRFLGKSGELYQQLEQVQFDTAK